MVLKKTRLSELVVSVYHEDCWTTMVGKCVVRNIGRIINFERNYIRAIIIFNNEYKDLIQKIKKHRSFIECISLYSLGDKIIFDFKKNTHGVIKAIISVDGIILDDFKYLSKEYWRILIYEDRVSELIEKLKSEGEVQIHEYKQFNITEDDLSPQELRALILAYTNGYYKLPKSIKSKDLAEIMGINKSTLIYHLRSAESKLIQKYLNQLKFENIINKI
ncbi:helix-turn-helix domain-containing protein [Saccharolobus solfataricus]|uniref:Helix-turn-helix domain-containing protein n=1 Tax=Saccharolobus solfataricus TaxID=2287 RepID=A0A3G8ET17_SACSO|nr:helix-turn-helix domain-containing protein [Saccharolobus solfataricus]AZF84781.1 helix-turn-helix domain-containing protein [Saccharolobus solfataricus]